MSSAEPLQTPEEKAIGESVSPSVDAASSSIGSQRATTGPFSAYPKQTPSSRAVREAIRQRAWQMAAGWDRSRPLSRQQIESGARRLLAELGQPLDYLGWTMVMLGSAFWQSQVAAVPVERRLLLLPHCFRSIEQCQGVYTAEELVCRDCGACRLSFLRAEAKRLGYQVLIAEGTPIVVDMILHGRVDAILGVACLGSLERALEKILQVGIPCMAVPLWESRCRDSQTDEDWVLQMLRTPYVPSTVQTETYLHLLRATTELFRPDRLARFLPGLTNPPGSSPKYEAGPPAGLPTEDIRSVRREATGSADGQPVWETTQRLAWDFLLRGGKHLRPFLTLAAYDAMTGARAARADGGDVPGSWPEAVWQLALAIEVFHKASLIHDDIEDDDPYRYGRPALHREYGTPTALNVGDFLIGWGYRLAAEAARQLASDAAADILAHLAHAHVRLSEGQGAELAWRQALHKALTPLEVLKIYSLKTAPAFEAALYVGLRMAGPVEQLQETLARYSRHVGVAFQIHNDLADWTEDSANKQTLGADVLGARPTILWSLARQSLCAEDADRLDRLLAEADRLTSRRPDGSEKESSSPASAADQTKSETDPAENRRPVRLEGVLPPKTTDTLLAEVRRLYEKAEAFAQAEALAQKHRERAHLLADQTPSASVSRLLHYVADMVLNR